MVEFGCGYGIFTLAVAGIVFGTVYALDMEPEMVRVVQGKCRDAGVENVRSSVRDFVADDTGLADDTMDFALPFIIVVKSKPRFNNEPGLIEIKSTAIDSR